MEVFLEMMGVLAAYSSFVSLVSIALYVLMSLGLYTLAQRRGIQHAWLAWVPVGSLWILGAIADDYQLKVMGQVKNRRKALLILWIVLFVLAILLVALAVGMAMGFALDPNITGSDAVSSILVVVVAYLALIVLAIVATVFQYICLYDLYASCDPSNKTLYLLLSIFVGGLSSIFVFICRNKDQGMYPPAPYGWQYQPQYQQPQYQPQYQQPQYQPPQYQQPTYQPPQYQPPAERKPEE